MAKDLFVGVDVGGTKVAAALVDSRGEILARDKAATPRGAKAKQILKVICGLVEGVVASKGLKLKRLGGVGLGAPGIVSPDGREVVFAPNIDLSGYPLADKLEDRLGVDVVMGNDVNLGVLGERWLGAAKDASDLVGIFPGTGVGGGVVVNGRLLWGAHGAGAELGHLIVEPDGPRCGCGNRGCLEALASRSAIERDIRAAVKAGERSVITELAGDLAVIKSKALAKALKKKDPVVTRVVGKAAERLGQACVSLRHVFDPELFVLGGGVIEACGDHILPVVQKALDKDPFFKRVGRCKAVPSMLADDAVLLGAVALARS